jgi:hypothetical protein
MGACLAVRAHDVITTKITWSREISRLFYKRCASCHRDGGTSFALTNYEQARPWAKAIKEEVLERRMPPWGAVKGFGGFRDDHGLTQEELELISNWVEGGAPEGEPSLAPQAPPVSDATPEPKSGSELIVEGSLVLKHAVTLEGVRAKTLLDGASIQVTAQRPDGSIEPLVWIYNYQPRFDHAYYYRSALTLPAGTRIETSPANAGAIALLTGHEVTSALKPAR